jgi:hypothetical protein
VTWSKLGDEFADECWTLSDAAFRLHVEGIVWSNKKQTDGQLAKDDMPRWARHPEAAAEELVSIGWWEDHGEFYLIVHHIGYQRTRAEIAHQSLQNKRNRAKGVARPVKAAKDESSDGSSDEMDRTGQDRPRRENRLGNAPTQKPPELPYEPTRRELDLMRRNEVQGYER